MSLSSLSLSEIYTKYNSSSSNQKNLVSLITTNPIKFLKNLKSNKNFDKIPEELQQKIINTTCDMIKSINPEQITLGLEILEEIISFVPKTYFENSFTYNKTLTENNFGIFACALEENKEIKIKTLKLVSQYSEKIKTEKHFDFILELINDEEDEVRMAAVDCLEGLINKIPKFSFQICEILLFVLKEKQKKLRKKFMSLISKMKFSLDQEKFRKVILALKDNFKPFPNDQKEIFKCVKNFSEINSYCLNEKYFKDTFTIDENFMISEYKWSDELYIVDMIVFQEYIFFKQFSVKMFIPKFFVKHFYYFEEKYPMVFDRKVSEFFIHGNKSNAANINMEIDDSTNISDFTSYSDNKNMNSLGKVLNEIISFGSNKANSTYTLKYLYDEIENHFNNKDNKEDIIKILSVINLQLSLEEPINILEKENNEYLLHLNNELLSTLLTDDAKMQTIFTEENKKNLQEKLKEKLLFTFNFVHPEINQIYSDSNRKSKCFPFSLPIQLKLKDFSQKIKNNYNIVIMKRIRCTINNTENTLSQEIILSPATGTTITSFSKDKISISIKKKESIFLPQKKSIEQFYLNLYINNILLYTIDFHIHM